MQTRTLYSAAEYLALETAATEKSEYRDGRIIPMTGGSTNHNQIIINLIAFLKFGLKGQSFRQFASDVKLWIPATNRYTYPDLMVVKDQPIYHDNRTDTIENPTVIVEVLSKSTQAYDRGDKFKVYRTLPSFEEYVLVNQYAKQIEHYVKTQEKRWIFSEYDQVDSSIQLEKVPFEISIDDLYDQVDFELESND